MNHRAELDAKGGSASAADKLSATPQGFRYQSVMELDPLRLASASQMMGGAEQYLSHSLSDSRPILCTPLYR